MSTLNKNILITGASGGIGKVLSTYFSSKGYNLALQYFNNGIDVKSINGGDGTNQIFTYKADIRNEPEVKGMMDAITQNIGGIDILD